MALVDWTKCTEKVQYQMKSYKGVDEIIKQDVPTVNCVFVLFERFIFFAFLFLGIVAAILIMVAAVRFILSGGDHKQIEESKKMITYALIGMAFVILSFTLLQAIAGITGVNCILTFGFTQCI